MCEPRYRDWILETIDSLRSRKARPDLERICRMVRRRHGSDPERTRAELEKLIQERTVLRVNYKGSVSYRNAARVQRKCRRRTEAFCGSAENSDAHSPERRDEPETSETPARGCGDDKRREQDQEDQEEESLASCDTLSPADASDLGDRLVAAVWSLSARNRAHAQPLGIKEILGYLAHADGEKLTRHRVKAVLEREIERGRLRRTRLGHITVPARRRGGNPVGGPTRGLSAPQDRRPAELELEKEEKEEELPATGSEQDETIKVEPEAPSPVQTQNIQPETEAEVKGQIPAPATAGPEVKQTDENHRPPPSPSSPSRPGSVQQEAETSGAEPRPVELVLQTESVDTENLIEEQRDATPDRIHTPTEDRAVLLSDGVKVPTFVTIKTQSSCKVEVGVSSCLLTPSASPGAAEERGMNGGMFVKSESSLVSPVDWTVADVASYFTAVGFPEQALAFRMQEIDGKSLLLMQRNDVLTGLSIRLGPALKIYERHVKVLQRSHFQDDEAFC
ncbi:sterile alpha motif domain-containing protein 1 [Trichomycterus rosablanca]|uniref:sterile alpha motif domain-containing protein 1 n=1 Tax=Trichomycterus rosablanca TaxID=2290929 RepID=UPI002F355C09